MLHSKVRSSKPRWPGEIRANPILCLQVGHNGRSAMEILITRHPEPTIGAGGRRGLYAFRLSVEILAQFLTTREPRQKIGIDSAGHGWMRDRHGLGPEVPYPQGRGRARLGVPRVKLADFGLARACRKLVFRPAYILPVSVLHFASLETLTRPVRTAHATIKQIALTEARRPGELECLTSHAQLDSVSFR